MEVKSLMINGIEDVVIIEETIDEKNLKPQECFIENYYSHISPGTELSRVYGLKPNATYPFRPGYCSVGKILAKGEELAGFKVGDFVLYSGSHSNYHVFDYLKSDGGILYKIPQDLPLEKAVCLTMCWIAMNGILRADVKVSDTVAIFGLGILGSVLSILYHQAGVKVIGVDPVESRAKGLPLDYYINSLDKPEKEVMKLTKGTGVDIAVDAAGKSAAICSAIMSTRTYGQVILLGSPREGLSMDITPVLNTIHMKMLTVKGSLNRLFPLTQPEGSITNKTESLNYLSDLIKKGIIDTDKFISHIIKPEDALSAYRGLMHDKEHYIGVIIDWKS